MAVPGTPPQPSDGSLDEAYERLHGYGPEFDGYLSNHGPMVAEVLDRHQLGSETHGWLDRYVRRLEEAPPLRARPEIGDWRQMVGDPARLGDWLSIFSRELGERPWREVLATWWPRLLPGSAASAAHPLIRTGHAVRALSRESTAPRIAELGQALGYWAARWHEVPEILTPHGDLDVVTALGRLPHLPDSPEAMSVRLAGLATLEGWPQALARASAPADTTTVPAAIDSLVDAAVTSYRWTGHRAPLMLVHSATAPSAVGAVLPELPEELWPLSYDAAWWVTAAITALYAADDTDTSVVDAAGSGEEALERALRTGDEHAIKFADVAALAHGRGCGEALAAAALADSLLG